MLAAAAVAKCACAAQAMSWQDVSEVLRCCAIGRREMAGDVMGGFRVVRREVTRVGNVLMEIGLGNLKQRNRKERGTT